MFIDEIHHGKDLVGLRLPDKKGCAFLSESSLKKDWLKPEEDEAWKEL